MSWSTCRDSTQGKQLHCKYDSSCLAKTLSHPLWRLADQIEELGELKYIILTHRDDVHGHDRWKGRFPNVKRIMHRLDSSKAQKTNECEVLLEGTGSWEQSDIQLIHTPGHTPGSICVLINVSGVSQKVLVSSHLLPLIVPTDWRWICTLHGRYARVQRL